MKILLIGGLGSIGRRYHCILKRMGQEVAVYDPVRDSSEPDIPVNSRVLIASPTESHLYWIKKCCSAPGADILCEKPLVPSLKECDEAAQTFDGCNGIPFPCLGVKFHIVCNYKFALQRSAQRSYFPTKLDYYNQGKDPSMALNCCQLVYINPKIELRNESPIWNLWVKDRNCETLLPYRAVEQSYVEMLDDWINNDGRNLWTMDDAVKMTKAVLNYEK